MLNLIFLNVVIKKRIKTITRFQVRVLLSGRMVSFLDIGCSYAFQELEASNPLSSLLSLNEMDGWKAIQLSFGLLQVYPSFSKNLIFF